MTLVPNKLALRLLRIALLISAGTLAGPCEASDIEHIAAVNKLLSWSPDAFAAPDQRRNVATAMAEYWDSFGSRVPRISPAEKAWLDGEKAASVDRYVATVSHREFALNFLVERPTACSGAFRKIAANVSPNDRLEALAWVKTINCYRDDDELKGHLERAGLSKGYDGAFKILMFSTWAGWIIDTAMPSILLSSAR